MSGAPNCLEPKWVPRAAKEVADTISRVVDCDDWQLNPVVFQSIDSMWGPTPLTALPLKLMHN